MKQPLGVILAGGLATRMGGGDKTLLSVGGESLLSRIIDRLEEPICYKGEVCKVSASIGTVLIQRGDRRPREVVLANADAALYASKHAGRGRHTFFDPALRVVAGPAAAPGQNGGS